MKTSVYWNRRFSLSSAILVVLGLIIVSTAQAIDGTFTVSESWSATLTYSGWGDQEFSGTRQYSGIQRGTIVVTGNTFRLLDQTGLTLEPSNWQRTISTVGGRYSIHAGDVLRNVAAGVDLFGILHLGAFIVKVPLVDGEIPTFDRSEPLSVSGAILSSMSGSGSMEGFSLTVAVTSTVSFLSAPGPPPLPRPPMDQLVGAGGTAIFVIQATANPAPSFRWQRKAAGSSTWSNLSDNATYSGTGSRNLSVKTSAQMDGDQFRCVVSNSQGSVTTAAATLSVEPPPRITTHPWSQTVFAPKPAGFTVAAVSRLPLTYQWLRGSSGVRGWVNLTNSGVYAGVRTTNLTVQATSTAMRGEQFRCLVSNDAGFVISDPAELRVEEESKVPPTHLDTSFIADLGEFGSADAIHLLKDGRILVGGEFARVNNVPRQGIARLNSDGSLDSSFNPGSGVSGTDGGVIDCIAVQPDGGILIGGSFERYNGVLRDSIARLNADGSLDSDFYPKLRPGIEELQVQAIVIQADGNIIVGGEFSSVNGVSRNNIARLHPDGSLDATFSPSSGATGGEYVDVEVVLLQDDGRILIGGEFTMVNGVPRRSIARLNADGTLDTTFDPGLGLHGVDYPQVKALALDGSGKILVGGEFSMADRLPRKSIARLNSNGTPDSTFDSGSGASQPSTATEDFAEVSSIALLPDGRVLIGGYFGLYSGTPRTSLALLKSDGRLDGVFDLVLGKNEPEVSVLVMDGPERVLMGGYFSEVSGIQRRGLARVLLSGGSPPPNTPPVIGPVPEQWVGLGVQVPLIRVSVSDLETPADALVLSPQSSNTDLVPTANISISATGEERQINIVPAAGWTGQTTVTVTVRDGGGLTRMMVFRLLIVPASNQVRLQLTRSGSPGLDLVFTAPKGGPYAIETSTDLSQWSELARASGTGAPTKLRQVVLPELRQRYYRARFVTLSGGGQTPGFAPITFAHRSITLTESGTSRELRFARIGDTFEAFKPGNATPIATGAFEWVRQGDNNGQLVLTTKEGGTTRQVTYVLTFNSLTSGVYTFITSGGQSGSGTFSNVAEITGGGGGTPRPPPPGGGGSGSGTGPASLSGRVIDFTATGLGNERLTFGTDNTVTSNALVPPNNTATYTYNLSADGRSATIVVIFPNGDTYNLNLGFTDATQGTWVGNQHLDGRDYPVPAGSSFTIRN